MDRKSFLKKLGITALFAASMPKIIENSEKKNEEYKWIDHADWKAESEWQKEREKIAFDDIIKFKKAIRDYYSNHNLTQFIIRFNG